MREMVVKMINLSLTFGIWIHHLIRPKHALLDFRCVQVCTDGDFDYAGLQYGSQCICTNSGPIEDSEEDRCTYGCAGDNSIKMCGGLGYINIFHTDAHRTTIDDFGCGGSAQDQYYQKWYSDMAHCGLTG